MDTSKAVADLLGSDDVAALKAQLAKMQAELDAANARASNTGAITVKLGKKGGLCVYGLQRRPVHLYASQWRRLLPYIGAAKDNPIAKALTHFAANASPFPMSSYTDDKADKAFIAGVRQGTHRHASISADGETVYVKLAEKALDE